MIFTYYAGIMLDVFSTYSAHNYASIIGADLILGAKTEGFLSALVYNNIFGF